MTRRITVQKNSVSLSPRNAVFLLCLALGHLFLLDLLVNDVPGGQLPPHILQGDAQLEHEDHHVVGQVGNLIDGLFLSSALPAMMTSVASSPTFFRILSSPLSKR